jgi:hypothetical protein
MGITLDKATIITYFSMSYSLANYQQSRDRIMGRGQKALSVTRYYLCCGKKVDRKVMDTLAKNEDVAKAIGDNARWFLDDSV